MTDVPPPKYLTTSKRTGTAPWFVGCIAIPAGATYKVTWTVKGPAAGDSGNEPQPYKVATFWFQKPGNNTITLTITNTANDSDQEYTFDYPVVVTANSNVGNISGFSMRPAAVADSSNRAAIDAGSPMGFFLAYTEMGSPCIKWDYGDGSGECNHNANPNHTYTTPQVISGQVTLYFLPPSGVCTCDGTPAGSKDFSLLVYDPELLKD